MSIAVFGAPAERECQPPETEGGLYREWFESVRGGVSRGLLTRHGDTVVSTLSTSGFLRDAAADYERAWLHRQTRPRVPHTTGDLRIVDLFAGVGGLSVGAWEACRNAGLDGRFALASEADQAVLEAYQRNFNAETAIDGPIESQLDGELGAAPTSAERALIERVGRVDLLLAGPPCQGHSDLNNHTRRNDERNQLYLRAIRFVELFMPAHALIENVPGVVHDRTGVVDGARERLRELGYQVDGGVVSGDQVGVPQRRRRFFLLASSKIVPSVLRALEASHRQVRPVLWAIDDLGGEDGTVFGSSARHSAENRRRIDYLFAENLFELPNEQRPSCHRDKPHSYRSVYGRMRPDQPAPTLTGGFGSTGQGRFVHPLEPRTLTPHEAARVQTFPDWFDFSGLGRRQLQKCIGNAVPPLMAAALVRELIA